MWSRQSLINALLAVLCLSLAPSHSAHAYIDPGTGSYIFQLAIAMGLAGAFLVKMYWRKLLSLFSRGRDGGSEDDD